MTRGALGAPLRRCRDAILRAARRADRRRASSWTEPSATIAITLPCGHPPDDGAKLDTDTADYASSAAGAPTSATLNGPDHLDNSGPVSDQLGGAGTLKATTGTWSPSGATRTYQWYRDSAKIKGATKSTYKLTKASLAHRITVRVTGRKSGYTTLSKKSPVTRRVTLP